MADNRIKKFWREDRGMMTVEAAVIVPMIAMILVGIVFLFLFFMDMAAARSEAMRVAEETAAAWKTDGELVTGEYEADTLLTRSIYFLVTGSREELEAEAQKRLTDRVNERLLVTRLRESEVETGAGKVTVGVSLQFRWPLRGVEEIMGEMLSFSCTIVSPVDHWQEKLRLGASLQWK